MSRDRVDWDRYFMGIARAVASRSTCPRRSVGAVLVQGRDIRGTGYNGAPAGVESCDEVGCLMRDDHCIRAIHAEANLLLRTDARDREGATVYVTVRPCWACANLLANAGIASVVHEEEYWRDSGGVRALLAAAGVSMHYLDEEA